MIFKGVWEAILESISGTIFVTLFGAIFGRFWEYFFGWFFEHFVHFSHSDLLVFDIVLILFHISRQTLIHQGLDPENIYKKNRVD